MYNARCPTVVLLILYSIQNSEKIILKKYIGFFFDFFYLRVFIIFNLMRTRLPGTGSTAKCGGHNFLPSTYAIPHDNFGTREHVHWHFLHVIRIWWRFHQWQ